MRADDSLDLLGVDVVAPPDVHVVHPSGQSVAALVVHPGPVAGA